MTASRCPTILRQASSLRSFIAPPAYQSLQFQGRQHTVDNRNGMFKMRDMTDKEAIAFLADKLGKPAAVADALGVSAQVVHNWTKRGISAAKRPVIWSMVNDRGGNLPREWLIERAA